MDDIKPIILIETFLVRLRMAMEIKRKQTIKMEMAHFQEPDGTIFAGTLHWHNRLHACLHGAMSRVGGFKRILATQVWKGNFNVFPMFSSLSSLGASNILLAPHFVN